MTIKRYDIGREYLGSGRIGVGTPAITEQTHGEYVLYADHLKLIAACGITQRITTCPVEAG